MNTRLQQFLQAENITQSEFADTIGVARASITHLLSGRNKPSFDFIESMAANYPALNLEWLITGNGRMYKTMSDARMANNTAYEASNQPENGENQASDAYTGTLFGQETQPQAKVNTLVKHTQHIKGQRNISKIVVFYDDGTFQELTRE